MFHVSIGIINSNGYPFSAANHKYSTALRCGSFSKTKNKKKHQKKHLYRNDKKI